MEEIVEISQTVGSIQFTARTAGFEGPLEVLLSLIEKHKLHINDISLAEVADDFISYTQELVGEGNIVREAQIEFLAIVSTLMLIKSKSLLPGETLEPQEEAEVHDLERRLKLLQLFRDISKTIEKSYGKRVMYFAPPRPKEIRFRPHESLTVENMRSILKEFIEHLPKVATIAGKTAVEKTISLEEVVSTLSARMERLFTSKFSDVSGRRHVTNKKEKVGVILHFLALLELVKRGLVHANQSADGDDIEINKADSVEYNKEQHGTRE